MQLCEKEVFKTSKKGNKERDKKPNIDGNESIIQMLMMMMMPLKKKNIPKKRKKNFKKK
jgi:hypothetical protein